MENATKLYQEFGGESPAPFEQHFSLIQPVLEVYVYSHPDDPDDVVDFGDVYLRRVPTKGDDQGYEGYSTEIGTFGALVHPNRSITVEAIDAGWDNPLPLSYDEVHHVMAKINFEVEPDKFPYVSIQLVGEDIHWNADREPISSLAGEEAEYRLGKTFVRRNFERERTDVLTAEYGEGRATVDDGVRLELDAIEHPLVATWEDTNRLLGFYFEAPA